MIDIPFDSLLDHAEDLRGKVILITGGAAGFGKTTALLAANHGAKVVIADLKPKFTRQTLEEIRKAGGTCSAPEGPVDVTDASSLQAAFEHCIEEYGEVPDIVIANAGVNLNDHFDAEGELVSTSSSTYPHPPRNLTLSVNLQGAVSTCEIAQEYWNSHPAKEGEAGRRRLIVMSSMGGQTSIPVATTYSTSKHAVLGYWKSICDELSRKGQDAGFQFFAICPFFANTRILDPTVLLLLAGIPLVPVPLIAKTMLYVASRPPISEAPGAVMLLPDHGQPAMALPQEYDPLSAKWSAAMNARSAQTDDWVKVSAWKRVWNDVARNYYGTSGTILALRAIVISSILVVLGVPVVRQLSAIPAWLAVTLGSVIGIGTKIRPSGSRKRRHGA